MLFFDIGRGSLNYPMRSATFGFGGGDLTNGTNDRKGNFGVVPTFIVVDAFSRCIYALNG